MNDSTLKLKVFTGFSMLNAVGFGGIALLANPLAALPAALAAFVLTFWLLCITCSDKCEDEQ